MIILNICKNGTKKPRNYLTMQEKGKLCKTVEIKL